MPSQEDEGAVVQLVEFARAECHVDRQHTGPEIAAINSALLPAHTADDIFSEQVKTMMVVEHALSPGRCNGAQTLAAIVRTCRGRLKDDRPVIVPFDFADINRGKDRFTFERTPWPGQCDSLRRGVEHEE